MKKNKNKARRKKQPTRRKIKPTVKLDFTDDMLTSYAGGWYLAQLANLIGLPDALKEIKVKKNKKGASDQNMLLTLIFSLANGDGAISDIDTLMADPSRTNTLGIGQKVHSKRLGEYLRRFDDEQLYRFQTIARHVAKQVIVRADWNQFLENGYIPVFVDGSIIEVTGKNFEEAKIGYSGDMQYWLHSTFIGGVWADQRLLPGASGVTKGWRNQIETADKIIKAKLAVAKPVDSEGNNFIPKKYVRADNAYYNKNFINYMNENDWYYTVSTTNNLNKKPLLREVDELDGWDWKALDSKGEEEWALVSHQPAKWDERQLYIVIRKIVENSQRRLFPIYSFILTNITDLPVPEVVRMHRRKQGQENEQKGPLIDLDLHHPSSSNFMANQVIYTAAQIAQNLIRGIQYLAFSEKYWRNTLRTMIRKVIRIPGKLVAHAGEKILKFSKWMPDLNDFLKAADKIELLMQNNKSPPIGFFALEY